MGVERGRGGACSLKRKGIRVAEFHCSAALSAKPVQKVRVELS